MGKIDKKLQEKGEEMDLRKTRGRWEKLQKIEIIRDPNGYFNDNSDSNNPICTLCVDGC